VAQFGSASGLGPEGRRFESCLPDHFHNMPMKSLAQTGQIAPLTRAIAKRLT
jgi:hypothetical protein